MKTEDLNQACPECGCKDKSVGRKKNRKIGAEVCYIPHLPEGTVGVIRCSECGHIFEYCKERKLKQEVKKLEI